MKKETIGEGLKGSSSSTAWSQEDKESYPEAVLTSTWVSDVILIGFVIKNIIYTKRNFA